MASATEHYREAERLMESIPGLPQFEDGSSPWATRALDAAQVHATLALAAATALTGSGCGYLDDPEIRAWREAAGVSDA